MSKWIRRGILGGGLQYWQRQRNLGAGVYFPLWEPSGTVVTDVINGYNGSSNGPTVGVSGIGDGKTAYSFDGSNDTVNIFTNDLAALFSGAEWYFSVWFWPAASGVWSDGVFRRIFEFIVDSNNLIRFLRNNANNQMYAQYAAGGTSEYIYLYGLSTLLPIHVIVTGSKANDRVTVYLNGEQYRVAAGTLGTFAGALTAAVIGYQSGAASVWSGKIQHLRYGPRELSASEARQLSIVSGNPLRRYSVLGDSISANANNWIEAVVGSYPDNVRSCLINHAVAGHSIVTNMATQVTAAANDDADRVYIQLGSNDNNAGNMSTLQSIAETQIDNVRTYNPRASIYWVGPPPRWTDGTGTTEVDLSNIRTAIKATCTAKSVTYIDTYDTPVWTAAQTTDGTHPNATGTANLVTRVLS